MRFSASALPLLVDCAASANPNMALAADRKNNAQAVGQAVHRLAEWYLVGAVADVETACTLECVRADDVDRVARMWQNLHAWLEVEVTHATK